MIAKLLNKKYTNEFIFKILLQISTLFVIVYSFADFLTVYYHFESEKFIFLDERRIFLEQNLLKLIGFFISILFLMLILKNFKNYQVNRLFIVFTIFFLISYLMGGFQIRPMLFFGYLLTFFFYEFYPKVLSQGIEMDNSLISKFSLILSIFLFAPLLVFCLHYMFNTQVYFNLEFAPQLYVVDSFRGLTLDRIQYSFLVGTLLLVVYLERKIIKNYKFILFLSMFALILSMSRAVVVSLIVAILFYKVKSLEKIIKFLFFLGFFILLIWLYSPRMDIFSDGGGRVKLLFDSFTTIFSNGYAFLFGNGNFYSLDSSNLYPHNSILQSLMDFGFIVTFLWLLLSLHFFKSLNQESKSFFIFLFLFGCFHPGFSVFIFMPMTIFGYVIVIVLNRRKLNDNIIS